MGGVSQYLERLNSLSDNISTTKVYTFCFWGVSKFLDVMKWEICGGAIPGVRVDFNRFCGSPPWYFAMYELNRVADQTDTRHLPSRKKYYTHVAIWSDDHPPEAAFLAEAGASSPLTMANSPNGALHTGQKEPKQQEGRCM